MIPNHQLISLNNVKGVGPRKIRSLLRKYPELVDLTHLSCSDLLLVAGISAELASKIKNVEIDYGKKAIENVNKMHGRYISYFQDEYPEELKTIYNAPIGLFSMGDFSKLPCFAVVGTRQPSPYGKKMAMKLSSEIINSGFSIASGFARGVDTIAHKTTIKNGGHTVAVLGNGLDVCYPSENKKLRDELIEKGLILTEFVPGTKPDAVNFPRRNRIISGLSRGVLVIEAGKRSGAIITALNALDQNREVFALPGQADSAKSDGTNRLIQQGAKLVMNVEDILNEFQILTPSKQIELIPDLTTEEKNIFQKLSNDPLHIDELCTLMKKDTPEVLTVLLMLELKNLVLQHPGKLFSKSS